jgi:hypothetical protein
VELIQREVWSLSTPSGGTVGAALFHQRFIDGFGRFLNLGLAFA